MIEDELSRHNRQRWNDLAAAGVQYSRPWLDLDEAAARPRVDPLGPLGDPAAKPGSWDHFCSIAPPWLVAWSAWRPDLLAQAREEF
jgi:hypothetical protein